jgi:hypothetical protein
MTRMYIQWLLHATVDLTLEQNFLYTFATVPFPRGFGLVASRFFSVSQRVLSQDNLCRRSLQGPRSATTGSLTNTTFSSGLLFIYLWQFTFGLQVGILEHIIRFIHGTLRNHTSLTIICIMCITIICCWNFIRSPKFACLRLHRFKTESSSLAYSALSKPNTPLCIKCKVCTMWRQTHNFYNWW